jgi:hypothetical protein
MMRKDFVRQLEQLLYSIGEGEGMITPEEADELLEKVNAILYPHSKPSQASTDEVAVRRGLHLEAPHALRRFLQFAASREHDMSAPLIRAFRAVSDHLSQYYAVTSKKEKDLLADLHRRAETLETAHRKTG